MNPLASIPISPQTGNICEPKSFAKTLNDLHSCLCANRIASSCSNQVTEQVLFVMKNISRKKMFYVEKRFRCPKEIYLSVFYPTDALLRYLWNASFDKIIAQFEGKATLTFFFVLALRSRCWVRLNTRQYLVRSRKRMLSLLL